MEEHQISRTAQMTAYSRGYHYTHDNPRIFKDNLAFALLSLEEQHSIEMKLVNWLHTVNPEAATSFHDTQAAISWMMQAGAAASIVLSRAAYAEGLLEEAVDSGLRQYVLLGAGFDTFAFRRPDLLKTLHVFEVDHPATQSHKRRRCTELKWQHSENLHFVPVDFTRQALGAALAASPFDPKIASFFSWLGVAYYLTREQVLATLREVAAIAAPGSTIVFDYLDDEAFVAAKAAPRVQRMLWSVEEVGEPMLSSFNPLLLADELSREGLTLIEDLSPMDIHQRWFRGRTDHYHACEHVHFARAARM